MTRERIKSSMFTLILILAITVTQTMAACLDSQVELPTTLECVGKYHSVSINLIYV